jgi:hypothetical protein
MRLPIGSYRLEAAKDDWFFRKLFLSYEDPKQVDIIGGGCAQIQFEGMRIN